MNTNDKNYVDRLHNQQVNELNEVKNRLLILEGKPTSAPNGTIRVEIDTEKVYEMFLKACHDCLQQRQERRQEEDRQAEERLRQECEAKGEPYYATEKEMCIAMLKEFNTFYRLIITYIKRTEKKFVDIHMDILKHLGASHLLTMFQDIIPSFQNFRPVSSQRSMNSAVALPKVSAPTSPAHSPSIAVGRF